MHLSTICHQLCLLIGPKNTILVEDVDILLPVNFRWIPLSGFRGEVENISANKRPGWPSCFSDWHKKKHKTWQRTLKSCFLPSFIEFRSAVSEEKSKMSQPIRGKGGHLVFPIGLKNTIWWRTLRSCFQSSFIQFCSAVLEEKSKCLSQSEARAAILFFWSARKTQTW